MPRGAAELNLADTVRARRRHRIGRAGDCGAAARRAREALGIDNDPDASSAARENLALNPAVNNVRFALGDVATLHGDDKAGLHVARGLQSLRPADVVTANLTGALLCRSAVALANAFAPEGRSSSAACSRLNSRMSLPHFRDLDLVWEAEEEGWVGLEVRAPLGHS